ncbi:MAG: hypothetical protein M3P30_16385 [Chloroflexota bacterium]|nr:hypothetical protein [Chloroflexota bacterium]
MVGLACFLDLPGPFDGVRHGILDFEVVAAEAAHLLRFNGQMMERIEAAASRPASFALATLG